MYCYQQAELHYYDQKKYHVRDAEAGLLRSRQGQAAVRDQIAELDKKMEDPYFTEN